MPKSKITFKTHIVILKAWYKYIKGYGGGGLSVSCNNCNSRNLELLKSETKETEYLSLYRCRDCDSEAMNIEKWYIKGEQ